MIRNMLLGMFLALGAIMGYGADAEKVKSLPLGSHNTFLQLVTSGGNSRLVLFSKEVPFDKLINERIRNYDIEAETLLECLVPKDFSTRFRQHYFNAAVLAKFDNESAFDPWIDEGTHEGTIIHFSRQGLEFIPNAQGVSKSKYGLSEKQQFLGVVGTKVFYWEEEAPNRIWYFDTTSAKESFYVQLSPYGIWPKWEPSGCDLVVSGHRENEVWVEVKFKLVRGFAQFKYNHRFEKIDLNNSEKR